MSEEILGKLCGRALSGADLERIRRCAQEAEPQQRAEIARRVCEVLDWHDIRGRPKLMSRRVGLLRLHRAGLIELPPPRSDNGNGRGVVQAPTAWPEAQPVIGSVRDLAGLRLEPALAFYMIIAWRVLHLTACSGANVPRCRATSRSPRRNGNRCIGSPSASRHLPSRPRSIPWYAWSLDSAAFSTANATVSPVLRRYGSACNVQRISCSLSMPNRASGGVVGNGMAQQPLTLVLKTQGDYEDLSHQLDLLMAQLKEYPGISNPNTTFRIDKPQLQVVIDRSKAAALGVKVNDIADTLNAMLGLPAVGFFGRDGYSYEVIPQVPNEYRCNPDDIKKLYVRGASGQMVSLENVVSLQGAVIPQSLDQFDQMRSATLTPSIGPGYTLSEAIVWLQRYVEHRMPSQYSAAFTDEARDFLPAGTRLAVAFAIALVLIYLLLATHFNSLLDPLVVMFECAFGIGGRPVCDVPHRYYAKHLYQDWSHHAGRTDKQERYSDRRFFQQAVGAGRERSCRRSTRRSYPPPPHIDDSCGDDLRRPAAGTF
jgi:hypothetical protein